MYLNYSKNGPARQPKKNFNDFNVLQCVQHALEPDDLPGIEAPALICELDLPLRAIKITFRDLAPVADL